MQACLGLGSFGKANIQTLLFRPLLMLHVATAHTTVTVDFDASKLLCLYEEKTTVCSK